MNTCCLLYASIVLAMGMGLVSCTNKQKNQGMTQPTPISQSLTPCQPAGVPFTGTPELCVSVTEVHLLSHETQADIGLSLMNRTGHKLFITLIGFTSLTDSNGRKWNTGDSKGLGSPTNPVAIEPGGNGQGALSFYQIGQSSTDLTFSLRGEIGIMKMDAHGHVVPGQIATKRGINLSGIRIQQQPPHPPGAAELNKEPRLAQSSPRRLNPMVTNSSASSKSSAPGTAAGQQVAGNRIPRKRHRPTQVGHPIKDRAPSILRPVMSPQTQADRNPSDAADRARRCLVCALAWRRIRPARCSGRTVSDHRLNLRIDPLTVMLRSRIR